MSASLTEQDPLVQERGKRERGGKRSRPRRGYTCVSVTAVLLFGIVAILATWALVRTYPAGPIHPGTFITNVALNGKLTANLNCHVPFDQRDVIDVTSVNHTNERSTNFEPALAVNPTDPLNMIITTHLTRSSREAPIWYTLDGGVTWTHVNMPNSRCGGPVLEGAVNDIGSASDPWVTFDKNGNAYASYLTGERRYTSSTSSFGVGTTVLTFKSTDKGRSWEQPTVIVSDAIPNILKVRIRNSYDKSAVYGDTVRDNVVYAVVTYLATSSVYYFRSTDGGNFYHTPVVFDGEVPVQPPVGPAVIPPYTYNWGSAVTTLSDGTVLMTCRNSVIDTAVDTGFGVGKNEVVYLHRSSDGVTFDAPIVVIPDATQTFFYDATTGYPVRDTAIWHDVAVNRRNDYVYIVTQDSAVYPAAVVGSPFEFLGSGTVITMSKDKGLTWSTKKAINPTRPDTQTGMATISVLDNGIVGIVHYTDRNHDYTGDTPNAPFNVDVYVSLFDANLNFLGEHRITPSSFNLRRSSVQSFLGYNMYSLGDYMKGSSVGNCFVTPLPIPASNAAGPPDLPYTRSMGNVTVVDKQYTKFARTCYNDILPITTEPVPLTKRQAPSHHSAHAKTRKSISKKDYTQEEIVAMCAERGHRMPTWLKALC